MRARLTSGLYSLGNVTLTIVDTIVSLGVNPSIDFNSDILSGDDILIYLQLEY